MPHCLSLPLGACISSSEMYSDVTVFHSFKAQVGEHIYELQQVMLHQPGRPIVVFSKKLNSFSGEAA